MESQYGYDDPRDVAMVNEAGKRLVFEHDGVVYRSQLRGLLRGIAGEMGEIANQRTDKLLYRRLRATKGVRDSKRSGLHVFLGVRLP